MQARNGDGVTPFCCVLLAVCASAAAASITTKDAAHEVASVRFAGTYVYSQSGEAIETLQIMHADSGLRGHMYGVALEGDHGRFYFVSEVTALAVGTDGAITFTLPGHKLYRKPVQRASDVQPKLEAGFTRYVRAHRGTLSGDRLTVQCSSFHPDNPKVEMHECPESRMVFVRTAN